jgi:hypothetical protein
MATYLLQPSKIFLQLVVSAIAIECDSESVDAVHLLQSSVSLHRHKDSSANSSHAYGVPDGKWIARGDYEWFDWSVKFPELGKSLQQTQQQLEPPDEAAEFDAPGAKKESSADFVRIWNHLGDNMWMETVDGKFHVNGTHAIDGFRGDQEGGTFSGESSLQYKRLLNETEWDIWWTADRMAQANAGFEGTTCQSTSCDEMYMYAWIPGWRPPQKVDHLVDNLSDRKEEVQRMRSDLDLLLSDYYQLVSSLQDVNRSLRLQFALPILSHFYLKLAYTHPFTDANTRSRVLFLNTELVRLGGHPVIFWDFRESQDLCETWWSHQASFYDSCAFNAVGSMESLIKEGWCAWEAAALTGISPYQSGERIPVFDEVTGTCI